MSDIQNSVQYYKLVWTILAKAKKRKHNLQNKSMMSWRTESTKKNQKKNL